MANDELNYERCITNDLKMTISELESQLHELKMENPFSSTPYHHHHGPSLHEEFQQKFDGTSPTPFLGLSDLDSRTASSPHVFERVTRSVSKDTHVTSSMNSFTKLMEETVRPFFTISLLHMLISRG